MKRKLLSSILLFLILACQKKPKTLFSKVPTSVCGITFKNTLNETHRFNYFTNPYIYLGGGVAVGDINNDGLEDLYFTGNRVRNKLYLNQGNFQFKDISESAGVSGDDRWYSGVTMVDINQDGYLDIYCSVAGKNPPHNNVFYLNNQDNTFTEQAETYGIACDGSSIQSTFLDYDKDGDLDLYVANYPPTNFTAPVAYYDFKLKNHTPEESDKLYRNDDGHFTDVTATAGLSNFGLSLGVVASDINNDGYPDLYVSNDFNAPDFLYINNQDGTFTNQIDTSLQQTSFFGMGVDIADFNNDGWMDIFQLDMSAADNFRSKANMSAMDPDAFYEAVGRGLHHQYMQNSLQLNRGNNAGELPLFSNIARMAGVASTDWSWGGLLADFDNDGWKDLFVTNGIRRDVNNKDFYAEHREFFKKMEYDPAYKNKEEEVQLLNYLEKIPSEKLSNALFQNQRNLRFSDKTIAWGLGEKTFSNGVVYADLDNDGDLDLIINNLEDTAAIYRNNAENTNYLSLELLGKNNSLPLGTKVRLYSAEGMQLQELTMVRGYLSSLSPKLHFGLGSTQKIDSIVIAWPDNKSSKRSRINGNQTLKIAYENEKLFTTPPSKTIPKKRFQTIQTPPLFKHQENWHDDFKEEILLPHKNSTLGPCLARGDLNGDGLEDFVIGGAVGQAAAVFLQNDKGGFIPLMIPDIEKDKYYEDLGIEIFDADNDGDNDLYIVSGGNEFEKNSLGYQDRFYQNLGNGIFKRNKSSLPDSRTSGLVISPSDFDHDGDLDLFLGGRLTPKKYPTPASSELLENHSTSKNPKFKAVDKKVFPELENMGLVTASVWIDFDQDSWEDLVVVGEWMPIRFFKNNQGKFKEVTEKQLLMNSTGWWYAIEKGDFDNDGDLDLIVGNLGQNYKYQASETKPFKIYLNDFDANKSSDIVLSYSTGEEEFPVRGRQCSSQQMPAIKAKFKDYNAFARADLNDIYTDKLLEEALSYQVTSFKSLYLENTNGHFKANPLPSLAQVSNINNFVVNDFNQDGNLDVVLGGNLYNSEVETPRNDASFGLWLTGDGKGNFTAKTVLESGLEIIGEVKDMELLKQGGSSLLLVAKNNAEIQQIKVN